ncbi:sugar ABC transporter ATP-binding protein [Salinibacterium sp. M195]|uniref:sugar ABC transporter ATP-binding protein n=1 Tax=Salinibacterium sp. M195 TaxID=2583374 RepID=UPI001C6299DB|nr:sugar ABC transporter ATP-binding protein [Salinibacterium sp. M195]QYH35171.1 sugar ABC transporter ATP-binding protein [Salinibacterium sp. M195]
MNKEVLSTTAPVLEVRNIVKTYGGVKALDDVSLSLTAGNVHCLAGENGCGKSTLIKIISGVEQPDSGEVFIDGVRQGKLSPFSAIIAGIQVIYQDFSLFPNLTVLENIVLTSHVARRAKLYSTRKSRPAARAIVKELGLSLDLDATVEDLSVADKQLTAICRALVNDARVIVMDEPTTALTHTEVKYLFEIVNRLRARGVALVFVSHKLEEALEVSQEVTILRSGQHVVTGDASEFDRLSITRYMTGRDLDESREVTTPDWDAEPLLSVAGLSTPGAFRDVTFDLQPGEILGITGLLGSGRTEIAEALFGVLPAASGTIHVNGSPVKIRSISDAIRAGIGYLPEDRLTQGLFLDKSVADNLIAGSLGSYRRAGIFLDSAKISTTISTMFERLKIKARSVAAPVRSLSGGNAQRVVLGKLLANRPLVLILNGPTVGVDVGSKEEILAILRDEASGGMGIIVISDDAPELVSVCNRVLVVRQGEIADVLEGSDITADNIQEKTTA